MTGNLSFAVNLFNPSAPAQLFNYGSAVVNILDADPGFSFGGTNLLVITNADLSTVTTASYGVLKSGTNVLITVLRSNANTGIVSVNYATATNENDNAVAGVDYGSTSGLLTFSNGVSLHSFTVPIFNNRQVESDRTFSINLFNPTGGAQLIPPSVATVTITNDVSGISFSSSEYRVNENGGSATITVFRSGYTNSIVSVGYATANTPRAGINYSNVSGTLTFTNGETVKAFSVPVMDDGVLSGDTVVPLSLANLVGNAVFVNPSAATLTVVETSGSLIVAAGSALTSESGPINGVIDPGERVTMLFALRDSVGTNTINLVATLLATNGVTKPERTAELRGAGRPRALGFALVLVHCQRYQRPADQRHAPTPGRRPQSRAGRVQISCSVRARPTSPTPPRLSSAIRPTPRLIPLPSTSAAWRGW